MSAFGGDPVTRTTVADVTRAVRCCQTPQAAQANNAVASTKESVRFILLAV